MIAARRRAALLIALGMLGAAALAMAALRQNGSTEQPAQRPSLLLLTSLPLVFNEGFSLQGGGSAALTALRSQYRVVPISVADGAELAKGRLLLMAQPQAQTAENLVVLDEWVRRGGRVLLLADPLLEWPSALPLGDPIRPPAVFQDTGLLSHWGLALDPPESRGAATRELGGLRVQTSSPGSLRGKCMISKDGLTATCRIGKGIAVVVADADFLDASRLGPNASHNLAALLNTLARMQRA